MTPPSPQPTKPRPEQKAPGDWREEREEENSRENSFYHTKEKRVDKNSMEEMLRTNIVRRIDQYERTIAEAINKEPAIMRKEGATLFYNRTVIDQLPLETKEALNTILTVLAEYSGQGTGTAISLGNDYNIATSNIDREDPGQIKEPLTFNEQNLNHIVKKALTIDETEHDNIDGAIRITQTKNNHYITELGILFPLNITGLLAEKRIPNKRSNHQKLPFSTKAGTRNLSALIMAYEVEKKNKEQRTQEEKTRETKSSNNNYLTIVLSASGRIRTYNHQGIIISTEKTEITKSELYDKGVYLYNMSQELMTEYLKREAITPDEKEYLNKNKELMMSIDNYIRERAERMIKEYGTILNLTQTTETTKTTETTRTTKTTKTEKDLDKYDNQYHNPIPVQLTIITKTEPKETPKIEIA